MRATILPRSSTSFHAASLPAKCLVGSPCRAKAEGWPTKHLAGSDAAWKDVEDRGNMVALMSYIK
eukprot:5331136-Alexandrium_andersonii.AAC.1